MVKRIDFFRSLRRQYRRSQKGLGPESGVDADTMKIALKVEPAVPSGLEVRVANEPILPELHGKFLPSFHSDGYGGDSMVDQEDALPPPERPSCPRRFSFEDVKDSDFAVKEGSVPPVRNSEASSKRTQQQQAERIGLLRRRLANSRSSSVMERIASLLSSNMSLCSNSESRPSRPPSKRSTASSLPPVKRRVSSYTTNRSQSKSNKLETGQGSALRPGKIVDETPESHMTADTLPSPPLISDEEIAVLESCCYRRALQGAGAITCVHQRLKDIIRGTTDSSLGVIISPEEASATDRLGNTTLHVASRWGAPLQTLYSIIEQGGIATVANNDRQTFLHLFRPWSDPHMTPGSVQQLMTALVDLNFNFCLRDISGKTFAQTWVLSPSMNLGLLEPFLQKLPQYARHNILSDQTSGGKQLLSWLRQQLDRVANSSSVQAYIVHATSQNPSHNSHPIPSILQTNAAEGDLPVHRLHPRLPGWNKLHNLVAAAAVHESVHAANAHSLHESYLRELDDALQSVDPVLLERIVNNRGLLDQRTPLMTLIHLWSKPPPSPSLPFLEAIVHRLLKAGASLLVCDHMGRTPLHYATEAQMSEVVTLFCRSGADVNAETLDGVTPLELARRRIQWEIERTGSEEQNVASLAGLLECGIVLIDHGGMGSKGQEWKGWFDWGRYLGECGEDGDCAGDDEVDGPVLSPDLTVDSF